ncbi:prepilin, shufflon protein A [Escherichia coli]|uniref:prepilin, shufflon protein A n=1 Tax=Escherichia coli TaxID=562 RepID=UPI001FCE6FFB|nr:prepilin, shufflon protein A [Escherichia coli]
MFTGIERTSQIKPIPELHSAPPPITFLPIGQVAVAPGQRSFDAVTLTISISPFPAFFHEPDWHWPPCQSGLWRTIGAPDGSYSNLGSHRGTFNGRNNGRGTLFVYASGGNGAGGGDCANTSNLQGYVNGAFIGMNASNNPSYGKTAFISFAVPVGASYQIISRPTQNYACGNGVFSVYAYQM